MDVKDWLGKDNELGIKIWKDKYQKNGESFEDWLLRVTNGDNKVMQLMLDKKFLFGGRILSSRGIQNERKVTFSNCYVLKPVGDSIEEIYETAGKLARTFSYGGGVGIDISNLRPKGAAVNNAALTTTGPVSFMSTFSQVSETIGQQGRRGALMISMDCNHPDIEEFINAKRNSDKINGANISVRVDEEFMQAVGDMSTEQNRLFRLLCKNNWDWAEPGILYWDTIKGYNLLSEYIKDGTFEFAGVNPCAEEPLPAGGSCLLGAINLSAFVENRALNLPEFKQAVRIAIRALNDVLDEGLELHPLPEQRECVRKWRQIGLGIMGFADMLIKMGIQYGSERCLDIIDMIGNAMVVTGLDESANIAEERGAFEMFDAEKILNSTFIKNNHIPNKLIQKIEENGLRNSQLFTIAPTGSIGTMLEISTGVEPVFSPYYTRTTKSLEGGEKTFTVIHPSIKEVIGEDIENIPGYIVWAGIIDPLDRVETQTRWQDYIDASISSTINLPQEATVEMVEELYYEAWKRGCKGITVFRDGCSRTAILNTNKEEEPKEEVHELGRGEWKTLAEDTYYVKRDLTIGCGKLKLFIGYSPSEQAIQDLYIVKAGQGGCEKNLQAIAICMSAVLRLGGSLEQLKKAFSGISVCPSFTAAKGKGIILSPGNYCGMAILKEIEAFMKEKHIDVQVTKQEQPKADTKLKCPECGAVLTMTGGCNVCSNCGYTKCD